MTRHCCEDKPFSRNEGMNFFITASLARSNAMGSERSNPRSVLFCELVIEGFSYPSH